MRPNIKYDSYRHDNKYLNYPLSKLNGINNHFEKKSPKHPIEYEIPRIKNINILQQKMRIINASLHKDITKQNIFNNYKKDVISNKNIIIPVKVFYFNKNKHRIKA